jgi:hypothetical protein
MNFKAGLVLWVEDENGNIRHLAELELHKLNEMETGKKRRKVKHLNIDLGNIAEGVNLVSELPRKRRTRKIKENTNLPEFPIRRTRRKRKQIDKKMVAQVVKMRLQGHMPKEIAKLWNTSNNEISKILMNEKKHNPELAALLNSYRKKK